MAAFPQPLPKSRLRALVLRCRTLPAIAVLVTSASACLWLGASEVACGAEGADGGAVRRAEAIATEAKLLFQQKEFAQAAERFMEAYTLARRPTLIYNAARAYQEAGNADKALALFRAYRGLPDVNDAGRADADARIAVLEKAVNERKAAEEAGRLAKDKLERERQEDLARQAQDRERAAQQAKEREAREDALRARLKAEADKPAPRRQFPTAAAAATGGLAAVGAGLYTAALVEAGNARDLESKLRTEADGQLHRNHVERATLLRNVAIGAGVLAAGCASWLVWELVAAPAAPVAPKTTIIRPADASPARPQPDIAVTLAPHHVGFAVRF